MVASPNCGAGGFSVGFVAAWLVGVARASLRGFVVAIGGGVFGFVLGGGWRWGRWGGWLGAFDEVFGFVEVALHDEEGGEVEHGGAVGWFVAEGAAEEDLGFGAVAVLGGDAAG